MRRNYVGVTWKPSFCTILAYFLAASLESSSDFAPVHTILPEPKMSAVVLGSRILMMTAAKRFGLYSALRACKAIFFRSSLHPRLTVDTIFWKKGTIILYNKCLFCILFLNRNYGNNKRIVEKKAKV